MSSSGHSFYPLLAETVLALYVLASVGQLAWITIPAIKEAHVVGSGDDIGSFRISILNDGEIEFAGAIKFGAADALRKVLRAVPAAHTIHLNNPGGRYLPAVRLRDVVREHNLDTYTRTECTSGCALVYLGGNRRYLHASGKLGFHRGGQPSAKKVDLEMVDDAVAFGVDCQFAEKAFSVPNRYIWKPKPQELIDAKYVTHIANGQFAISGYGAPPERSAVKTELLSYQRYATAHEAEPASLEIMTDIFIEAILKGTSEALTSARLNAVVVALIEKYLPLASDGALIIYASDTAELAKILSAVDPEACRRFMKPEKGKLVDGRKNWPPEVLHQDMRRTVTVHRSRAIREKRKRDPVPKEVVEALYQKSLEGFSEKYGAETLQHLKTFREDPAKLPKEEYCSVISAFYEQILTLPKGEAVIVLRDLFSPDT